MTSHHIGYFSVPWRGCRATCYCGWSGPWRDDTEERIVADGEMHLEGADMSDPPDILPIEDVRDVADWGDGHPVVGPCARTALYWYGEAEQLRAEKEVLRRQISSLEQKRDDD